MKPRFSPSSDRSCVKMADPFADLSESDFACLLNQNNSENTKKATKVAHNVFWEYLKEKNWRRVTRLMKKKKSWWLLKQYRYIESVNVVILVFVLSTKLHLIDKRIQFAIQEEQLHAECGARLKNFHSFIQVQRFLLQLKMDRLKYWGWWLYFSSRQEPSVLKTGRRFL